MVAERLGLLPGDPPCNVFARLVAGLEGDRAELGENLVLLRVGDPGDVSDGERLRMLGDAQVGLDTDPVAFLEVEPE